MPIPALFFPFSVFHFQCFRSSSRQRSKTTQLVLLHQVARHSVHVCSCLFMSATFCSATVVLTSLSRMLYESSEAGFSSARVVIKQGCPPVLPYSIHGSPVVHPSKGTSRRINRGWNRGGQGRNRGTTLPLQCF